MRNDAGGAQHWEQDPGGATALAEAGSWAGCGAKKTHLQARHPWQLESVDEQIRCQLACTE